MIDYAFRELLRRKRRTLATVAGYVFAVAIITIIITILLNGEAAANSVLSGTGTHFTAYLPSCAEEACQEILLDREHEGFYVGSTRVRLMENSILTIIETSGTIADTAPFLIFRYRNAGYAVRDFTIGGIPAESSIAVKTNSCSAQDVIAGGFFTGNERDSVVVEEQFAQVRNLAVGAALVIGGKPYRIRGIVRTGIRMAKADVYLVMDEATAVVNTRLKTPLADQSSLFLFESKNSGLHELAVNQVKQLLGSSAAISSYNCWKPASQVIGINTESAFLITLVVFICLLAFSLQAQYASVVERRHDMGILAAIGWDKGLIIRQILFESLIQALAGWVLGSILAALILIMIPSAAMVGTQAFVPKQIFPAVFLFNFILAAGGGAIAGILPGFAAASAKPAECIRKL